MMFWPAAMLVVVVLLAWLAIFNPDQQRRNK